jgi:hypothetical protein
MEFKIVEDPLNSVYDLHTAEHLTWANLNIMHGFGSLNNLLVKTAEIKFTGNEVKRFMKNFFH